MDVLTKEQRRKNMKAIKSKDTKMEVKLAKALWAKGFRYRKHKIAIFVDSEFFHGKDWETQKYKIKSNREFWWNKIEGNIARDKLVNSTLVDKGWIILRFWSKEVKKDLEICIDKIEDAIRDAKVQRN